MASGFSASVANDKFQRRFDNGEPQVTGNGQKLRELTLEQFEERWQQAKVSLNTEDTNDTKAMT